MAHARRSWRLAKAREGERAPYVWSEHAARSAAPHSAYDPDLRRRAAALHEEARADDGLAAVRAAVAVERAGRVRGGGKADAEELARGAARCGAAGLVRG